jgi:hypothetical protein
VLRKRDMGIVLSHILKAHTLRPRLCRPNRKLRSHQAYEGPYLRRWIDAESTILSKWLQCGSRPGIRRQGKGRNGSGPGGNDALVRVSGPQHLCPLASARFSVISPHAHRGEPDRFRPEFIRSPEQQLRERQCYRLVHSMIVPKRHPQRFACDGLQFLHLERYAEPPVGLQSVQS